MLLKFMNCKQVNIMLTFTIYNFDFIIILSLSFLVNKDEIPQS